MNPTVDKHQLRQIRPPELVLESKIFLTTPRNQTQELYSNKTIQLTPKGKARYPAFQMHRKHITALSPTQTYTPKRTRTPLIHVRCTLPRFPS